MTNDYHKVGEQFWHLSPLNDHNVKLEVEEQHVTMGCVGCYFLGSACVYPCRTYDRKDGKHVIYKQVDLALSKS